MGYDQYGHPTPDDGTSYLPLGGLGGTGFGSLVAPSTDYNALVRSMVGQGGMIPQNRQDTIQNQINDVQGRINAYGNKTYNAPSYQKMQSQLKPLPQMPVRNLGQEIDAQKKGGLIAGLAGLLLGGAAGLPPIVGAGLASQGLQQNLTGLQDRANQTAMEQYANQAQRVQAQNAMVRQQFADQMGQADREQVLRQRAVVTDAQNTLVAVEQGNRLLGALRSKDRRQAALIVQGMSPSQRQQFGISDTTAGKIMGNWSAQEPGEIAPEDINGIQARVNEITENARSAAIAAGYAPLSVHEYINGLSQAAFPSEAQTAKSPAPTQTRDGTPGGSAMEPLRTPSQTSQPSEHAATRRMADAHYYAMRDAVLAATGRGIT